MSKLTAPYTVDLHGADWRKSSYTANNSNCVEVARVPGADVTAVRDSKNTHIPAARVSCGAWDAFVAAVANGSFES
ncbi:DUF397 domain-containing protein [Streptomyces iconiensis]|uniref:DUF397 domain-containing protein n=1 Tax=Streptomyces iconiensis TaxID=1384038 RepID=A0ABT6ZPJ6_9ACTN|nr:DUF397 domain-containing protein [Streptomyces iconiensis]MDJ1130438.1 DUF397 domain-containing protein [Streptomyces iconiensis]